MLLAFREPRICSRSCTFGLWLPESSRYPSQTHTFTCIQTRMEQSTKGGGGIVQLHWGVAAGGIALEQNYSRQHHFSNKQVLTWRGSCCGPVVNTNGKNRSRRSAQAFPAVGAPQFFQRVYDQKVQNSISCPAAGCVDKQRYWAVPAAQKPLKMLWCHHGKADQSSCQWLQVHKLLIAVSKGSWWNPSSVLYLAHQMGKCLFLPRGLCREVCSSGFTLVKKSLRRYKNTIA